MINFRGDSDAHIVKGLVAITLEIFSNRKASEILSLNAIEILRELELDEHLSLQRANGLKAMIAKIKDYAQDALN
jgi:cysteine desulfuration protein SufE